MFGLIRLWEFKLWRLLKCCIKLVLFDLFELLGKINTLLEMIWKLRILNKVFLLTPYCLIWGRIGSIVVSECCCIVMEWNEGCLLSRDPKDHPILKISITSNHRLLKFLSSKHQRVRPNFESWQFRWIGSIDCFGFGFATEAAWRWACGWRLSKMTGPLIGTSVTYCYGMGIAGSKLGNHLERMILYSKYIW